jgi:hypothetical protein
MTRELQDQTTRNYLCFIDRGESSFTISIPAKISYRIIRMDGGVMQDFVIEEILPDPKLNRLTDCEIDSLPDQIAELCKQQDFLKIWMVEKSNGVIAC